jgi:antitoxin component of MazEF toxin-antitoxin module
MEMPVKFEISVVQVGKSLKVTIPVEITRHLKLEKGDLVEMWVDNSHIIINKKRRG